jgi:molybdenum cofactor cytidylyltransferase
VKSGRYAAIVLAAGLSRRMQQFKPLLPLNGETITDRVISTFVNSGVEVFLVVGYRHEELRAGIKKWDVTILENVDYSRGMFSSIQTGVSHLQPWHSAFFIMPVDIPLVRASTVRLLTQAAAEHPDNIIYPVFRGTRGHPPLLPASLAPLILGWSKGDSLKEVLASKNKLALDIPLADGNILRDVDTPEDYAIVLERCRHYGVPDEDECEAILSNVCRVTPDIRRHCRQVAIVALRLSEALSSAGSKIDVAAVRAAALLHDIAKGQPKHDIAGGQVLRDLGFTKVADIVGVHTDLSARNEGISLETKIVYLADKFVEEDRIVTIEERYRPSRRPFATSPEITAKIQERKQRALHIQRELEEILGDPLEKVIFG